MPSPFFEVGKVFLLMLTDLSVPPEPAPAGWLEASHRDAELSPVDAAAPPETPRPLGGSDSGQSGSGLGPFCQEYLEKKNFTDAYALQEHLQHYKDKGYGELHMPCSVDSAGQRTYAPDPRPPPHALGAKDTTNMACRYGNPTMFQNTSHPSCCGLRPHFNWVVATCEEGKHEHQQKRSAEHGQFCNGLPECVKSGAPKINYVAAYQFDGEHFVLMDDSSAGDLSESGIAGNFWSGTGWTAKKELFRWPGGDWTTKYAPHARAGTPGHHGPRGLTPPAGLWVLSAENFYYGAFYMLSQLTLNLEGQGKPNCWTWEVDAVEGILGLNPGKRSTGNVNMLYSTSHSQDSGCMPVAFAAAQVQGLQGELRFPKDFAEFCKANPNATGCTPWETEPEIYWSGGSTSSNRFENFWDEPYVFAVLVDQKGYWTYRWKPDKYEAGSTVKTGWPGVERHHAARKIPARPAPVKDPRGLQTDVPGDVAEAVVLMPGFPAEAACLRSSIEEVNWAWGSSALGSIATELGQNGPGGRMEGAQNWWSHFADTGQYAGYAPTIAGVALPKGSTYSCDSAVSATCSCRHHREAHSPPSTAAPAAQRPSAMCSSSCTGFAHPEVSCRSNPFFWDPTCAGGGKAWCKADGVHDECRFCGGEGMPKCPD